MSLISKLHCYHPFSKAPWNSTAPVREELFSIERLELHALTLSAAQTVSSKPAKVVSLQKRLVENAAVLLRAYRASNVELGSGRIVVPAAEWLLDNYHLVEDQIREIRADLPAGYYRQLPKLASGPFRGYPRVFGLAWAFIAHTDSHIDPEMLRRFITAYQSVQVLTIGELWAVPITLRVVLVENLRRLSDQMTAGRAERADADELSHRLLVDKNAQSVLEKEIETRGNAPLSEPFAAQLAKRLRDQDPVTTPAFEWLENRLKLQNLSVEEAVQHAQLREGQSNVTVRNVITSMRFISDIDWAVLFESVSLVDAQLRESSDFADMDFPTRNLYRNAIEQLARRSPCSELEITDKVLHLASVTAVSAVDDVEKTRTADPGYYLIGAGRRTLEQLVEFKPPARLRFRRMQIRLGVSGYVTAIMLVTTVILLSVVGFLRYLGLDFDSHEWLWLLVITGIIPATEIATAVVNALLAGGVAGSLGPVMLPALELKSGVPSNLRTLIAVPTLLSDEADILNQAAQLEVHFMSGIDGDLTFAILSDWTDSDKEQSARDTHLLNIANAEIVALNQRYPPGPAGPRFLLLHRRRLFNSCEQKWMGWERKRGKLHELNQLLRGATDTTFLSIDGKGPIVPAKVRYVITLDADTRLPRECALKLIGKMAHPLNQPQFSEECQRVVAGYGILQPRVTPSLPTGREGSLFQRVFSSPGGIDPYAGAVSDIYQDLFDEGSFTGKGIYDVDAFKDSLAGRVPENSMLSHDLFEGIFARAGLASDVEVVEEFPARYDVAGKRQHRWVRGDWQLLPWVFGLHRRQNRRKSALSSVGRWKVLDNLRRSLVAPFTLTSLALSWLLPLPYAAMVSLFIVTTLAIPVFIPCLHAVIPCRRDLDLAHHYRKLLDDLKLATLQTFFSLVFLPDQSWRMTDAIFRTLVRMLFTRKHLLEWTTSAQSRQSPRLSYAGYYRQMALGTVVTLIICILVFALNPVAWPLLLPAALLWLAAPGIALLASRSPTAANLNHAVGHEQELRLIARRTWRYFETFVTPHDNMLPPDNFQEVPESVLAHRTSPTNIGLYLLSAISARDFGWAGNLETVDRLEAAFTSMQKLARFKGHFYNWYATESLEPLAPAYISSVDSGNLAGHLIALANACDEWCATILVSGTTDVERAERRRGMQDTLRLARADSDILPALSSVFADLDLLLNSIQSLDALMPMAIRLINKGLKIAVKASLLENDKLTHDLVYWLTALQKNCVEFERDHAQVHAQEKTYEQQNRKPQHTLIIRLNTLAHSARTMAMAMDFGFLLDAERNLLSIGYSIPDNSLDTSCYDLLASEARLASLIAVAKGDLPTKHWFRLGRTATPLARGSALISWSGSMFEYLMPALIIRAPLGSLLEQANRLVVERQQSYGRLLDIPWGISESAYNVRDMDFTYQYSNFGVPGLGLKRGLSKNRVIAPYATGLATMVDAQAAVSNFAQLDSFGALGTYGYYDALDFTRSRLPEGDDMAIVYNYMAHHQGMTIVAINNALKDGIMRARFHKEPMIKACELLLQERIPRDMDIGHPRADEVRVSSDSGSTKAPTVRSLKATINGPPVTHILSNGRYTVMLTAAGAGYSRWRDIAITRWREDSTRDPWGSFIFFRQVPKGSLKSAALQPLGVINGHKEGFFSEDQAEFNWQHAALNASVKVIVSGEDDGEVRQISFTNSGRNSLEVEMTSYAELVLAVPAADNAHAVFSKMFVQTEFVAEFGALIATRRQRSPTETAVWAAHFAVVEGELSADPQYETDRMQFIGRGNSVATAKALAGDRSLTNTVGTVLDPIFSLRYRVIVPPGKAVRVAFWTVVAASRTELLGLIDVHHDRNAFDRARTLAWTQAQVQLHHLGIESAEAADFQRLAAPIIYADPRFRAPSEAIIRGSDSQASLWAKGISGDLPIVLLRIDHIEDIALVRQLLRAHEYWQLKGLALDLVIVNEHASSYFQNLQTAIETAVRSSQSRPQLGKIFNRGTVFTLRADLLSVAFRDLLKSVARVTLVARRGDINKQLAFIAPFKVFSNNSPALAVKAARLQDTTALTRNLEFFNGLGGFSGNGTEYVTVLENGQSTPAPWINVIANSGFGFIVTAEGGGFTWAENSRENQLTPWSNDPVCDSPGEAIYIRDEDTLEIRSATVKPIQDRGSYIARHGFGWSRFEHYCIGLSLELLQYVPLDSPIKISRLVIKNLSGRHRRLSITSYVEWVLGATGGSSRSFIETKRDTATGGLLARNSWSTAFPLRVAFADMGGRENSWTCDRKEFLGRNEYSAPAALRTRARLSGASGAGIDPCAAQQCLVEMESDESTEIVIFVGQCTSERKASALIKHYRETDLDKVLDDVKQHWQSVLGSVQVKTPDRAMDIMLNGWLQYQTLACRIWARSAFYQSSGAYGFRDQLQDSLAMMLSRPALTRSHVLRAAARQFVEGDVQHWWLPHSGQGVRTHISDDRVWLAFAVATYIQTTGDTAILDESVPFLEGPALAPGEHDAYFQPMIADESASLFEHCARGLDQCIDLSGEHGLPLMGSGDWNDGMNRVGEKGQGESVWLAWLLLRTLSFFAPLARARAGSKANTDPLVARIEGWDKHYHSLRESIEKHGWDGKWYRRATFDDGAWIGSRNNDECRIDSIAQSWAVISEAADPQRAATAMDAVEKHLILQAQGIALLFTPAFDKSERDPGYIKAYPPGLRENGGQYTHGAIWAISALAKLGRAEQAVNLFSLLNPINHTRDSAGVSRYKVEPYVMAADVYSVTPHVGRGGWTWYTGAAGWMYRAGVEMILGIQREAEFLRIKPCIPADWPGFSATVKIEESLYEIQVQHTNLDQALKAVLNGVELNATLAQDKKGVKVGLNKGSHTLTLYLPHITQHD